MALDGKRRVENAGIQVKGENEWLTLIQNSSRNRTLFCDYAERTIACGPFGPHLVSICFFLFILFFVSVCFARSS